MNAIQNAAPATSANQGFAQAVSGVQTRSIAKAGNLNTVSRQWAQRPDDQRFLNLNDLYAQVREWADESRSTIVDMRDVRVSASRDDFDTLRLVMPEDDEPVHMTHWSFGQVAGLLQVPAGYLRKLPASIAGINLQYAAAMFREEAVKAYVRTNGESQLRAATGPEYGRIYDWEVVEALRKIAGSGDGTDSNWKVPGVMSWETGHYDPLAPITKQTTTLYASDRDVFAFLVDDTHPIEIGKLPNGDPDVVFRGFYAWNSEVGSKTFGLASFYYRYVCQNRIIWGVEGFEELTLRHSKGAPQRFIAEARPALESFSNRSTGLLLSGIKAAREAVVARNDEERADFLTARGFAKSEVKAVIDMVLQEENKAPESIWDFVQGITAVARERTHADERVELERRASKLLAKVAR